MIEACVRALDLICSVDEVLVVERRDSASLRLDTICDALRLAHCTMHSCTTG